MSTDKSVDTEGGTPAGETDWAAVRAMSDEERETAARDDPDAPPLPPGPKMHRMAVSKRVRIRLGISQSDFATRYRIPLQTVEQWERYTAEPDDMAKAYLAAIAADPEGVAKAVGHAMAGVAAE